MVANTALLNARPNSSWDVILLSPEVQRVVELEAQRAWRSLRRHGFETTDLIQEFQLHLLRRIAQYDERRASLATFVSHVCKNKAFQLMEKETAKKRNSGGIPTSLSALLENEGGATELSDTITEDEYALRTGRRYRLAADLLALRIDTEGAVSRLPAELMEVAHLLAAHELVRDIDRTQGISRSSGARRRARMRTIFVMEGLAAYVETREAA
jgi:DNA-directed RNA polymerase specialized sigma24 family protein